MTPASARSTPGGAPRWSLLVLAAAGFSACATAGPESAGTTASVAPGVTLTLKEDTYSVTGRTFAEVGLSLQRRSPYLGGRSVRGIHSYGLRWRYSYARTDGGCRIDSVEVDITSTILLPRWRRPAGADPAVAEAWQIYLEGIRDHEDQHRVYAVQAALEIQRAMAELEAPTCSTELGDRANQVGREILTRFREQNAAFDRASPGARWPPYGIGPPRP